MTKDFDPQQLTLASIKALAMAAIERGDKLPDGPYVVDRDDDADDGSIEYHVRAADGTMVALVDELLHSGQAQYGRANLNLRLVAEQIAASLNDAPLLGAICLALLEKVREHRDLERRIAALEAAVVAG